MPAPANSRNGMVVDTVRMRWMASKVAQSKATYVLQLYSICSKPDTIVDDGKWEVNPDASGHPGDRVELVIDSSRFNREGNPPGATPIGQPGEGELARRVGKAPDRAVVANEKPGTILAYVLWLFTSIVGRHRFYLGKTGTAITMLVLTIHFATLVITIPWAIVDLLIPGIRNPSEVTSPRCPEHRRFPVRPTNSLLSRGRTDQAGKISLMGSSPDHEQMGAGSLSAFVHPCIVCGFRSHAGRHSNFIPAGIPK